jgi:hypothetical protein
MTPTLPEILKRNQEVEQELIANTDEVTPEQWDEHFKSFNASLDKKVDSILAYMDDCKFMASKYSERAEALNLAAKRLEKRCESLEKYVLYHLSKFPELDLRGSERTISKRLGPVSLVCKLRKKFSSANVIPGPLVFSVPEKYREFQPMWVLNTDLVKEDLKAGKDLDFAKLEQNEFLSIKVK